MTYFKTTETSITSQINVIPSSSVSSAATSIHPIQVVPNNTPPVTQRIDLAELEAQLLANAEEVLMQYFMDGEHLWNGRFTNNEFFDVNAFAGLDTPSWFKFNLSNGHWAFDSLFYEEGEQPGQPGHVPIDANLNKNLLVQDRCGEGLISFIAYMFNCSTLSAAKELKEWIDGCHPDALQLNKPYSDPNKLYGIERLTPDLNQSVIFTANEQAADAIRYMTPFIGVCIKADCDLSKVDFSPLKGHDIYLWPDYGAEGNKQANLVANAIFKMDRKTSIIKLNSLSRYHPEIKSPEESTSGRLCELKERDTALPSGFNAADAFIEGWNIEYLCDILFKDFQIVNFVFSIEKVGNFLVKEDGVYEIKYKDGEEYLSKISSCIEVTALTRDSQNKNWGMLLVFHDSDGVRHEWAMPKELLASKSELCQVLLSRGADVLPTEHNKLPEYLMEAKPVARARCVSSPGWHDGLFVTPNKSYGASEERVLFQTVNARKASPFSTKGTLQEWQAHIGSKCVGNSRLILGACIALTGPFLESLKLENGGVNLRGESSTGKTKSASVAGSIWGGKGMVNLWKATGNGIESIASAHNDAVLILDELAQVDPREAGDIAYLLGNGQGKTRSNVNGDAKDTARWRLLFLSTGEISLADQIVAGGGRVKAGQEVRMLDIPSDAGAGMGAFENIHGASNPKEFADSLQYLTETYFGTVADALLTRITQDGELAKATEYIRQKQDQFVRQYVPANAHGQVSRAASRFGAVVGVGEYCVSIGILPWEAGHATWGVRKCFIAWLESRCDNTASEDIRALSHVRAVLESRGESGFTVMQENVENNVGQRTINRLGFRQVQADGSTEFWVLPEMFNSVICEGFDRNLVIRVLKDQGFLELDSAGKSSVTKQVPGIGRMRVYVIKASLMQSDECDLQEAI